MTGRLGRIRHWSAGRGSTSCPASRRRARVRLETPVRRALGRLPGRGPLRRAGRLPRPSRTAAPDPPVGDQLPGERVGLQGARLRRPPVGLRVRFDERQAYRPTDLVLPDQFIDRTHRRVATFFRRGVRGARLPGAPRLSRTFSRRSTGRPGSGAPASTPEETYLGMEGPQFSDPGGSRSSIAPGAWTSSA